MYWGILRRTIFMELVRVFSMSLVALTGILLLGGIFAEATKHGLSPGQVLAVIPLLIPNTLPYTLPTTTLFATCVIYGRLAHDNEILAIKAAGVNIMAIIWPAVLLGFLASAATFVLYMDLIPSTHNILRNGFANNIEELIYTMLRQDGRFCSDKVDYEIYVRRVENRTLIEAEFRRRNPKTNTYDVWIWARQAELHVDLQNHKLKVSMHHWVAFNPDGQMTDFTGKDRESEADLPDLTSKSNRPSQMRWLKLFEMEGVYREQLVELRREIELLQHGVSFKDLPTATGEEGELKAKTNQQAIEALENRYKHTNIDLANVIAEYHLRPSLALGCLCFVLVGCPIGIWFSKSDYLSAFITCFMPIVVMYYPLLLCGINIAKSGSVYPGATIWIANGLMAVAALFLFRKLLKH